MKVGILTCHAAYNYGSVLQAFALQELIRGLGHEVEIVDCRPSWFDPYRVLYFENPFRGSVYGFCRTICMNVNRLLCFPLRIVRRRVFESFMRDFYRVSQWRGCDMPSAPLNYDAYVIGSDQVWNPLIFGESFPIYMGRFATSKGTLKIGYALSAGGREDLLTDAYSEEVDGFSALSVREQALGDRLNDVFGRDAPLVLDPTMSLERERWLELSQSESSGDYIVVYLVYHVPAAIQYAKRLAREMACRVRVISSGAGFFRCRRLHQDSPIEFLNLIRHAKAVVTTSFHGTAFSIIFGRPFYFVSSSQKGENRQRDLLEQLGLVDRIICAGEEPWIRGIDYEHVWEKLRKRREESVSFLRKALS